jgi:hypothetical protein
MALFRGGMKWWGGRIFSGERVRGGVYPLFQPGEKNIDISGNFGALSGSEATSTIFRDFVNFLPILIDFLLNKRIFERVGGYHFFG